ncbi:hypothetical protein ACSQ67_000359 [Phaseolus vulgaris]
MLGFEVNPISLKQRFDLTCSSNASLCISKHSQNRHCNGFRGAKSPPQTQRLQIYPNTNSGVSPFWREKYEREAKRYWDVFYKRHKDRFFKDRHYLDKEWGEYFSGGGKKVILEVGCGAGNTTFPVISSYPDAFVYACDFSPRAVELVKISLSVNISGQTHEDYKESHISAFVSDLTADDLCKEILPSSVDIVTMIFMLSAVSPEKMPIVLQNVRKVIKPDGYVLFRDYATGDLAQERFSTKDQKISENFYVRGDGTRAYYFSNEFLTNLFKENGFDVDKLHVCCKQVENRSRELIMNRRWVQAVFRVSDSSNLSSSQEAEACNLDGDNVDKEIKQNNLNDGLNDSAVDLSEGVAFDMFGVLPSSEYEFTFKRVPTYLQVNGFDAVGIGPVDGFSPRRKSQHCCREKILELGCGSGGICSMIAAKDADLVVATDGDGFALDLLAKNVASNIEPSLLTKLTTKRLEWGNKDHIESIKEVVSNRGFDVIIGTDVTYIPEAILPLFATAKELIATNGSHEDDNIPSLILCHIFRRVDEPTLLSAAEHFGFRLVDKWPAETSSNLSHSIIDKWFIDNGLKDDLPSTALNILLFCKD